jgi:hypothetical protein
MKMMNLNYMTKYIIALLAFVCCVSIAHAENWDYICSSDEYYYGVGIGATNEEADKAAFANLISQIATHVSSDFTQVDDVTNRNGNLNHQAHVLSCVKTYSQATLTNVHRMEYEGKTPNITARIFMAKSELIRIFNNRINKAMDLLKIANECLSDRKIDMSLRYYYWAYSLLRSVQYPDEVKDNKGYILVNWIPFKIEQILSDISADFEKKDGDFAYIRFLYQGSPVSSLDFTYSDGRTMCQGMAKDGQGVVEMIPEYETDVYHLNIEYQYKGQAVGDEEIKSVLEVITPKIFAKAEINVDSKKQTSQPTPTQVAAAQTPTNTSPAKSVAVQDTTAYSQVVSNIAEAITNRHYSNVTPYFTIDGLQMFNRLTGYGKARIMDGSNIRFYKGLNGKVIARGLKMSFSFVGRRKKTFIEDISFTFNQDGKIENVALGLGKETEESIFNKKAGWTSEVRENIVSFMENYKTAYSLERLDYIRDILADDAVIIVGNVVKRRNRGMEDGLYLSKKGEDIITYNRCSKDDYIDKLEKCFNRNDFINLRFTDHQIQWLEKFEKQTIMAINIRQEYNSSTYSDEGYLFLLIDMTDTNAPQIKVRTWQPNEVSIDKIYNAGNLFND